VGRFCWAPALVASGAGPGVLLPNGRRRDTLDTRAGLARWTGEAKDGPAPGWISYR